MVRLLLAALLLLSGCASLPSQEGRTASFALADTSGTPLAIAIAPLAAAHPGKSGIHALANPNDAFAARMLLAAAARRSLDAQYYIWHADATGMLLLEALREAARRGVRVRLLVDDQNTKDTQAILQALGAEPNLEIRLYNPFAQRKMRAAGYLTDFERLNRRMHNKSFNADNHAAVVGGRNIGNEYFAAGHEVPFIDLDVLAVGTVVPQVSAEFDLYWNSASAYPSVPLLGSPPADAAAALDARFAAVRASPEAQSYIAAARDAPLIRDLLDRRLAFEWTDARVVRDDPAKTLDREARKDVLLLAQLLAGAEGPKSSFDLVSPYFVPGERGTAALSALAQRGVRVRVLTNSFAGTDVSVVHSGYAKRRCALARAGVKLYELKPSPAVVAAKRRHGDDDDKGGSKASLHAKTFAADGERIFVGSFNFDPRSALLNTEMGLVISSPTLARHLGRVFDDAVPANAYEVRPREGQDCVEWIERTAAGELRHDTEPGTSWGRRAWLAFLAALPLDWML